MKKETMGVSNNIELELLNYITKIILEMGPGAEVRHIELPKHSGKTSAAKVLTHYNIGVIVQHDTHRQLMIKGGANPDLVFNRIDQLRGRRPTAIILDDCYSSLNRDEAHYYMQFLKTFDCPILCLSTPTFIQEIFEANLLKNKSC